MSYYRGDYHRGDYYRGDPFIGALVAGVGGKLVKKGAGWVGRKLGGAGAAIGRGVAMTPPILRDAAGSTIGGAVGYGIGRLPTLSPSEGLPFGLGGKKKYRKMNPLNPRALRRALRRAEGFEKFAKRTVNALYRNVDGRRTRSFKKRTRSS